MLLIVVLLGDAEHTFSRDAATCVKLHRLPKTLKGAGVQPCVLAQLGLFLRQKTRVNRRDHTTEIL